MIYQCCDLNRKAAVLGNPILNGINYLEVLDHDAIALASHNTMFLHLHTSILGMLREHIAINPGPMP